MSLPGRFLNIGGNRVFYHRSGSGGANKTPVVLVHGFLVSHWQFRFILPKLAEKHDVIAFDFPGFGESDRPPPATYRYDAPAFMDTLVGLLDQLAIPKAHLVGHSMGAAVSLYTAARKPDRVDRLVAIDPLVYPFHIPPEGRLLLLPYVGEPLLRALYTRGMVKRYMKKDIYRDPAMATEEWVDYVWERINRPGGMSAAHAALRFISDPAPIVRCVRAVRAKTLVVWGEDDRLFPSTWARRLTGDVAGSEAHIIPVCGHSPPEERPDETLRCILPFLRQHADETMDGRRATA